MTLLRQPVLYEYLDPQCYLPFRNVVSPNDITASPRCIRIIDSPSVFIQIVVSPMTLLRHPVLYKVLVPPMLFAGSKCSTP